MCAILDANAAHQVFGHDSPPAGEKFLDWINSGRGKIVVGGKLRKELDGTAFGKWLQSAILAGKAKNIDDKKIEKRIQTLRDQRLCRSDDHHVIALAQLSGARLLYSNDTKLHEDFKNKDLIRSGKIYSTLKGGEFTRAHETLLRRGFCPA